MLRFFKSVMRRMDAAYDSMIAGIPINYERPMGTPKRTALIVAPPAVWVVAALVAEPGTLASLAIMAFAAIAGLGLIAYGIFGWAEVWRFERERFARYRSNLVWRGVRTWHYGDIRDYRQRQRRRDGLDGYYLEVCLKGGERVKLPEQRYPELAERLEGLIRERAKTLEDRHRDRYADDV